MTAGVLKICYVGQVWRTHTILFNVLGLDAALDAATALRSLAMLASHA